MTFVCKYNNPFINEVFEDDDARAVAEYITEHMNDDAYDEMLDECYDEIEICGYKYSPSVALYRVDKVAYNCGRNDYYDNLASDMADEIDRLDNGEEVEFYGYIVTATDDDDSDDDE